MSAAAFLAGTPVEVTEHLGRYRTRFYANGYSLTYAFMIETQAGGLRVECRELAAEALNDDAIPLAGTPTWVVTRDDDPDGQAPARCPRRRRRSSRLRGGAGRPSGRLAPRRPRPPSSAPTLTQAR